MTDQLLTLAFTRLAGQPGRGDLLVVGAGLGTAAGTLWGAVAALLGERDEVVGVDLPGHGRSLAARATFTVADLATAVRTGAAELADGGRTTWYAGVSLAGAVGLELARDPGPFRAVAALASASTLGDPASWTERAELVRRGGTPVMVSSSAQRWFAPGFVEHEPDAVSRMLHDLSDTDDESYALCCEALAAFDVRGTLSQLAVPVLLGPGELDPVVSVERAAADAEVMAGSETHVFAGCAHQPPVEAPAEVARALTHFFEQAGGADG